MQSAGSKKPEVFRSGGLASGVIGIVCVIAVVGLGVGDPRLDFPLWGYPLALLIAGLLAALLITPCLRIGEDELELRNPFGVHRIPWSRIDGVEIGQVTKVRVGDDVLIGSAFGRTRRAIRSDARLEGRDELARPDEHSLGWLVEQKIERRVLDARRFGDAGAGVDAGPPARSEPARTTLAVLGALAVLTVVLALV